jgi:hypothetical protein
LPGTNARPLGFPLVPGTKGIEHGPLGGSGLDLEVSERQLGLNRSELYRVCREKKHKLIAFRQKFPTNAKK